MLVELAPITVAADGTFRLHVGVGDLGNKGSYPAPPAAPPLPLPYNSTLDTVPLSQSAPYWSDLNGAWEIVETNDTHGRAYRQMCPETRARTPSSAISGSHWPCARWATAARSTSSLVVSGGVSPLRARGT
jgi:hypothetical protein